MLYYQVYIFVHYFKVLLRCITKTKHFWMNIKLQEFHIFTKLTFLCKIFKSYVYYVVLPSLHFCARFSSPMCIMLYYQVYIFLHYFQVLPVLCCTIISGPSRPLSLALAEASISFAQCVFPFRSKSRF